MEKVLLKSEFNLKEFLDSYCLTGEEYSLMDFKSRMLYAERCWGEILKKLPNVGDVRSLRGYMHPRYKEYFNWRGYKVENFDFGREEVEITRIRKDGNTVDIFTEEDNLRLDNHIFNIAKTKGEIILDHIYDDEIDNSILDFTTFYNSLSEDERYAYADMLYGKILDNADVKIGERLCINRPIPECFDEYFIKRGYSLQRSEGDKVFCCKQTHSLNNMLYPKYYLLFDALARREKAIANAVRAQKDLFTSEYINSIIRLSADKIPNVGKEHAISLEEKQKILASECELIPMILEEDDEIELKYIPDSYLEYLGIISYKLTKK